MAIPVKVLLTGFEPFGGEYINPSLEVARKLHGRSIGNSVVYGARLPVLFHRTSAHAIQAIERIRPNILIGLGLANGRDSLGLERVAINLRDGGPDNAGVRAEEEPIVDEGPAAYFATLPLRAILSELRQQGIKAKISNTAGTYCCNELMYSTLDYIEVNRLDTLCGFIHVPRLPAQDIRRAGSCSMELKAIIQGVQIAIEVCVKQLLKSPQGDLYRHNATDSLLRAPLLYS